MRHRFAISTWITMTSTVAAILSTSLVHAQSLDNPDSNQGAVEVTNMPTAAPNDYPAKASVGASAGGQPQVGRKAASRYMAPREGAANASGPLSRIPSTNADHYLAVHVGTFLSDSVYKWGAPDFQSNVGGWNLGVTYRIGEWVNSMDLTMRVEGLTYGLREGRVTKLSFSPAISFPDASAKFPLYFGAGMGLGVFVTQLPAESPLALDYQLFAGARFFDVIQNTGFFIEGGLKNHLLLLSDGQFNGTFAALGMVFTF